MMQQKFGGLAGCIPRLPHAQTRLAAAKSKAEAVVGQEDLSERGKAREIEKLYAKARAGKGAKKAKPTRVQKRHGSKGPPLDGRMRADKRQVRCAALHLTALCSVHSADRGLKACWVWNYVRSLGTHGCSSRQLSLPAVEE